MKYALIENGIVANLAWLHDGNASDFPGAVKTDGKPVRIGDSYAGGKFWRDGAEVLGAPEASKDELRDMQTALNTLGVNVDG